MIRSNDLQVDFYNTTEPSDFFGNTLNSQKIIQNLKMHEGKIHIKIKKYLVATQDIKN